jgi:hypothetical protein
MRPTDGSTVYRPDLGDVVIEAQQDAASRGFVGLEVMPPYPTVRDTSTFKVIPLEQFMKQVKVERSARGGYNRTGWEYERGYYKTEDKGIEEPLDDDERARLDAEAPGLAEDVTIMSATDIVLRAQEIRIADKAQDTAVFDVKDVSNKWDVAADGTPIADVNDAKSTFRNKLGVFPNLMVICWSTYLNIVSTAEVRDQLKYTFPGIDMNRISAEQLAAVFNIDRVRIANAMYDSADEGQSRSLTDIWSDLYAGLYRVSNGRDLRQPCVGRTFIWTKDSQETPIVEVYRENQSRSDVYRCRHHVDERLIRSYKDDGTVQTDIAKNCGLLIGSIKTTS